MEESTWFHGFDKKYFYDRGVVYYEMFGWLAPIMLIQFMIRKYHVYHGQVSFFEALNQSINGVKRSKNNK